MNFPVPSFVSNFNLRKSKQTLIAFDLQYKPTSKINKLKHRSLKRKLSQVSVISLSDSQLLQQLL